MSLLAEVTGSIGSIGYGLAAIGPGVGIGIIGSAASFTMAVALTAFELLIQALQAYIFTLLAAVYIAGALHAEH